MSRAIRFWSGAVRYLIAALLALLCASVTSAAFVMTGYPIEKWEVWALFAGWFWVWQRGLR